MAIRFPRYRMTDRRGTVLLEFAIVGPVFLMIVLFVVQVSLQMLAQVTLDYSLDRVGRQVEIGTIRTGTGDPQAAFKNAVCQTTIVLGDSCVGNLQVYGSSVSDFSQFGALTRATVGRNGRMSPRTFDIGGSGSFVLLQVAYKAPNLIPYLNETLGTTWNVIQATTVLENEPY